MKAETRWFCVFNSSFRYDRAPCISHETADKVKTFCGRDVEDAATLESDDNDLDPDCKTCRKEAHRRKKKRSEDQRANRGTTEAA